MTCISMNINIEDDRQVSSGDILLKFCVWDKTLTLQVEGYSIKELLTRIQDFPDRGMLIPEVGVKTIIWQNIC